MQTFSGIYVLAAWTIVLASLVAYTLGRTLGTRAWQARQAAMLAAAEARATKATTAAAAERAERETQVGELRTALQGADGRLNEWQGRFARLRNQARVAASEALKQRQGDEATLRARGEELAVAIGAQLQLEQSLAEAVSARMAEAQQRALLLALGRSAIECQDGARLRVEAAELAARQLAVPLWGLFVQDETRAALRLVAGGGWKGERIGRALLPVRGGGLGGFALASGEAMAVQQLSGETRFVVPPILAEHGVVSIMVVPVSTGPHGRGLVLLGSNQPRLFWPRDLAFGAGITTVLDGLAQRERSAEALSEAQTRSTAVESASLDAILVVDELGRVEEASGAAAQLFARRAEELTGVGLGDLLPGAEAGTDLDVARTLQQRIHHFSEIRGFTMGRRLDGRFFRAQVVVSEARFSRGRRFIAVVRDPAHSTSPHPAPIVREPHYRFMMARRFAHQGQRPGAIAVSPRPDRFALYQDVDTVPLPTSGQ